MSEEEDEQCIWKEKAAEMRRIVRDAIPGNSFN